MQRILDDEASERGVPLGPSKVEFPVEGKCGAFVCDVADGEEGDEGGPEEEGVDGEDGTGVEDCTGCSD